MITVIRLLNIIANGEKIPTKIKYMGSIYEYNGLDYVKEDNMEDYDDPVEFFTCRVHLMDRVALNNKYLNEKVEIMSYE